MRRISCATVAFCGVIVCLAGCHHPSISAVSLNARHCDHHFAFLYDPCKEPEGIPFYLPKPLLIISKNFRNIEEAKVGLTDGAPIPNFYDDQAKYADLNARTNFAGLDGNAATGTPAGTSGDEKFPKGDAKNLATVGTKTTYSANAPNVTPGGVAPDGLKPEAFYTYHIIFVPDLTQKYGLKIKGGAGEFRAAMNLVNGWQFTGLGPYYMKDSSTAQNTLAGGITANLAASGVADVVKQIASLKPTAAPGLPGTTGQNALPPAAVAVNAEMIRAMSDAMRELNPKFVSIPAYAEISIYEPFISPEGTMEWKIIAEKSFDRNVVTTNFSEQRVLDMLGRVTGDSPFSGAVNDSTSKAADESARGGAANPAPVQQGAANAPPGRPRPAPVSPVQQGAANAPPGPPKPAKPPAEPDPEIPQLLPIPDPDGLPLGRSAPLRQGVRSPSIANLQGDDVTPPPSGATMRRSIQSAPQAGAKLDGEVLRAQGPGAALPPPSTSAQPIKLGLSAPTDTGEAGDGITESTHPQITVQYAPPDSCFSLLRDGRRVNVFRTQSTVPPWLTVPDDRGPVSLGEHKYEVVWMVPGRRPESVAQFRMRVIAPPAATPTGAPTATTQGGIAGPAATIDTAGAANPATTISAVASDKLVRQVLSQFGTTSGAKVVASSPAPTVVVPAAPPSSGNQVNLNQFFGKTKLGGASHSPQKRFSLLHHKEKKRGTIRTLDVDGIDADAAAVAAIPSSSSRTDPSATSPAATTFQRDTSVGTVERPSGVTSAGR